MYPNLLGQKAYHRLTDDDMAKIIGVPAVHNYTQYNGRRKLRRTRKSLGLAKTVSEDWANLLLNEKFQIGVDKASAKKKIDAVLVANEFAKRGNQLVELAFALGTGAFVEYLDGDDVKIDYIRAGMIYPISWDNGRVLECAFASERATGKQKKVYLNIHRLEAGKYVIENHMFDRNGSVLTETDLPDEVLPEVRTGSAIPRFQIFSPNIANNIDPDSPLGISVYANALDQLESADLVYDSYCNEFRLGRKRITVPISMARMAMEEDGTSTPVFDDNDTEFYAVPQDDKSENKIQEHNMEIRSEAHDTGIQTMLNLVSWKTGSGGKRYVFRRDGQVRTATEVISENSDLYRNLKKHELSLEAALLGMIDSIADLLHLGTVKASVSFDDSIISDTDSDKMTFLQEIRDGVRQKWEYRVKFFGEDTETAKAMVESGAGLTFG